jgi:hypothetical protein
MGFVALFGTGVMTAWLSLSSAQLTSPGPAGAPPTSLPLMSAADSQILYALAQNARMGPAISENPNATIFFLGLTGELHVTVQNLGDSTLQVSGIGLPATIGAYGSLGFVGTPTLQYVTISSSGGTDTRFIWVVR